MLRTIYFSLPILAIGFSLPLIADETEDHTHDQHSQTEVTIQSDNAMDMEHHDHATMDHDMNMETEISGTVFTNDITGLPDTVLPETVYLKDGETYTIMAEYVKKQIGNHTLRMLAYNRSIPGPFIQVDQNSEVLINFINKTDIDQTIHSHGVRVDNRYDGVPEVTKMRCPQVSHLNIS